ncbi:hypothetical protein V8C86DRAFT_2561018 [Haematococcus lacustris]
MASLVAAAAAPEAAAQPSAPASTPPQPTPTQQLSEWLASCARNGISMDPQHPTAYILADELPAWASSQQPGSLQLSLASTADLASMVHSWALLRSQVVMQRLAQLPGLSASFGADGQEPGGSTGQDLESANSDERDVQAPRVSSLEDLVPASSVDDLDDFGRAVLRELAARAHGDLRAGSPIDWRRASQASSLLRLLGLRGSEAVLESLEAVIVRAEEHRQREVLVVQHAIRQAQAYAPHLSSLSASLSAAGHPSFAGGARCSRAAAPLWPDTCYASHAAGALRRGGVAQQGGVVGAKFEGFCGVEQGRCCAVR